MNIKIKYHADIEPITQNSWGDWIDLRAAETVTLQKGEFTLISLGVSMELPEGYEAHLVPRSSTFIKFGIIQTNHIGIIDNSFSSDKDIWKFPALAMRDAVINKGDRICQFRIVESQPRLRFEIVDSLNNRERGGFGSSGVR